MVPDTNAVLSSLVFGGSLAGHVSRAWQQGATLPLTSTVTVQDLVRVLAYPKFRLTPAEQNELLADFLPYTETVRTPNRDPAYLRAAMCWTSPLCTGPWRERRKCWYQVTAIFRLQRSWRVSVVSPF